MGDLLAVGAWILGLALLASPVLAWVAYVRSREVLDLRRRIEALERRAGRRSTEEPRASREEAIAGPIQESPASRINPPAERSLADELADETVERTRGTESPERSEAKRRASEVVSMLSGSKPAQDASRPPREISTDALSGSAPAPAAVSSTEPTSIDWERWLGVRGAAVVGGISLALAGLFFFQYAVAHGWFGPALRILTGSIAGIACIAVKSPLHRRGYGILSDVLAGAGTVLLYGAAWASYRLYGFVPLYASFAWMAAVTALAGLVAVRYDSQVVAIFGLVGGFATPLLLSSGENRPLSLFGYILVLDLGLLALSRRRGWPLIGALGLVGTALVQGLWILLRMEPAQASLGLGVLGLFAALFVAAGPWHDEERAEGWVAAQVGGLVVPFLFAFYFALAVDMGPHLWPLGLLLALLSGSAAWVGRRQGSPEMPLGAALAAAGVSLAWTLRELVDPAGVWELVAVGAGLTGVFAVATLGADRNQAQDPWIRRPETATAASALGFLVVLFVAGSMAGFDLTLASFATGAALLAALALWTDRAGALRALPLLSSLGVGAVLATYGHEVAGTSWVETPGALAYAAAVVAFGAVWFAASFAPVGAALRNRLAGSIVAIALPTLLVLEPWSDGTPVHYPIVVLLLSAVAALGASRAGSTVGYAVTAVGAVFALTRWNVELSREEALVAVAGASLAWQAVTLASLAWIPALGRRFFHDRPGVLWAAALVPVLWAVPLNWLAVDELFTRDTVGLQLAALASIAAVGALGAVVPHGMAAAGLACFALARWIGVEWLPIGAAFAGLAWLGLARALSGKRGHVALGASAYVALGIAGFSMLRRAVAMGHFERTESIIWNGISFAYLVTGVALLLGAVGARRDEALSIDASTRERLSSILGGLAVFVVFAGLNLLVVNAYGEGPRVRFEWHRVQDRDLVQSLVWGLYAVLLLVVGTLQSNGGLRWMSLTFLIATIAKVFLYDLGELTGLYRAGSMMGLAICLLGVSLLYQRFVLRRTEA